MATNLKSNTPQIDLTRFWGGKERGSCIQISTPASEEIIGSPSFVTFKDSIQLTRSEACALAMDLLDFSSNREKEEI
tara:strand:- start:83 stop:313 length:231 start_codon:yes stop_codon:yes gene_type:complete